MRFDLWSVVFVMWAELVDSLPKSGPYDIKLYKIDDCPDQGTKEVLFGTKVNNKGNNVYTYTDMVYFLLDWDNSVRIDIDLQILKNGVYKPRYMTQSFQGCESYMKVGRELMTGFFAAAGYKFEGCPLPAGNYSVKDWTMEMKINNIPTMVYNKYRAVAVYSKKEKRLGCLTMYTEVVPKAP